MPGTYKLLIIHVYDIKDAFFGEESKCVSGNVSKYIAPKIILPDYAVLKSGNLVNAPTSRR